MRPPLRVFQMVSSTAGFHVSFKRMIIVHPSPTFFWLEEDTNTQAFDLLTSCERKLPELTRVAQPQPFFPLGLNHHLMMIRIWLCSASRLWSGSAHSTLCFQARCLYLCYQISQAALINFSSWRRAHRSYLSRLYWSFLSLPLAVPAQ